MSRQEFLDWPHKAITLLGMSGVGKTTLANRLPKNRWFHYSGDYRIGTKYLAEPILDNIKRQAMQVPFLKDLLRSDSIYIASNITVHNLEPVSTFLGKIGRAELGGLTVPEFKERQRLHREAEIGAMRDVAVFIEKAREIYGYDHFMNDSGGSICELDDEGALKVLTEHTLILYLRPDAALEQLLIQRAIDDPKPMYYQDQFLDEQLHAYLTAKGLQDTSQMDPNDFARTIFPALLEYRKPKYQGMADAYGYTVDANDAAKVVDESSFIELVTSVLD
jgi:hypothetical protein